MVATHHILTRSETVHFDKITSRIEKLCYGLASEYLDIPAITLKVVEWKFVHIVFVPFLSQLFFSRGNKIVWTLTLTTHC